MTEKSDRALRGFKIYLDLSDLQNLIDIAQKQINYFTEFFLDWHYALNDWSSDEYVANLSEFEKELTFIIDKISSQKSCSFFKKNNARLILEVQEAQGALRPNVKDAFEIFELLQTLRILTRETLRQLQAFQGKPILNIFNKVRNFTFDHIKGGVRYKYVNKLTPEEQDELNIQKLSKLIALKIYSISHASSQTQRKISNFCDKYSKNINSPNKLLALFHLYLKNLDIEFLFNQVIPILFRDFDAFISKNNLTYIIEDFSEILSQNEIPNARKIRRLMRIFSNLQDLYQKINDALEDTKEKSSDISKSAEFCDINFEKLLPEITESFQEQNENYNEYAFMLSERQDTIKQVHGIFSRIVSVYISNNLAPSLKDEIKESYPVAKLYFSIYEEYLKDKSINTIQAREEKLELEENILPYLVHNYIPQNPTAFMNLLYMRSPKLIDDLAQLSDDTETAKRYFNVFSQEASALYKLQELLDALRSYFAFWTGIGFPGSDRDYIIRKLLEEWPRHSKQNLLYSTELFYMYISNNSDKFKEKFPAHTKTIDEIRRAFDKYPEYRMSVKLKELFKKEGWL